MHVKNDRVKAIHIIIDRLLDDQLPAGEGGLAASVADR